MLKIDDVTEPQIGQRYLVRVGWPAKGSLWKRARVLIPLLGPLHEDKEIINADFYHYHIDWRFVQERVYQAMLIYAEATHCLTPEDRIMGFAATGPESGYSHHVMDITRATEFRPRTMLRFHHVFPQAAIWIKALEAKYEHARMKNFICPHRGISCAGGQIIDGAVVCPGHGLRFDVETGALRRRVPRP